MLRKDFVDQYNDEMAEAFSELFNTARKKMFHPGDLLLCQQNGTMFGKDTVIGPGEEGLNCLQQINALFYNGIGKMTGDNDYFTTLTLVKQGNWGDYARGEVVYFKIFGIILRYHLAVIIPALRWSRCGWLEKPEKDLYK